MGKLQDKVAIITGANTGIGEATARLFSAEGAKVVIFTRREWKNREVAEDIGGKGGCADYVTGDVTKYSDVARLFETVIDKYGRVDILVNNAGVADDHAGAARSTDENWEHNIAVNQTGPFYTCREALRHMTAAGGGVIVNVSSIGGVYSMAGAPYSSAKLALLGLTKNIAMQYGSRGVRCNSVCPGPTNTDMLKNLKGNEMQYYAGAEGPPPGSGGRDSGNSDPIEMANAILFFACDESRRINGQYLVVDNGMNL